MLHLSTERFSKFDSYKEQVPLDVIKDWLAKCDLTMEEVDRYRKFDDSHYTRNLIYAGPTYHILLLCWRNGQRSPIHDHKGSNCGVRVMQGDAIETTFQKAPNGMVYPVESRTLTEGSVIASQDADIHQVSNLQAAEKDLVTLHIYSQPLLYMTVHSLVDARTRRVFDPINQEFASGDGI